MPFGTNRVADGLGSTANSSSIAPCLSHTALNLIPSEWVQDMEQLELPSDPAEGCRRCGGKWESRTPTLSGPSAFEAALAPQRVHLPVAVSQGLEP